MTNSPRVSGSNRLPILFYIFHEHFSRLESGDVVLGDDDCSILGNVAGCFFRTFLDDEATEAAKIYIVAMSERVFDHHSPHTCSKEAPICAPYNRCSATNRYPQQKSTCTSTAHSCATKSCNTIPATPAEKIQTECGCCITRENPGYSFTP